MSGPFNSSANDAHNGTSTTASTGRVGIIGRPNVGKSTLFNILVGGRKALVKNQPGVTRDLHIDKAEWCGREFEVMDTGGLTDSQDPFSPKIKEQVRGALRTVDVLVVIMDGRAGVCPEDEDVMRMVFEANKPYLIVVNKIDKKHESEAIVQEFLQWGENVVPAAFEQRHGLDNILEWIVQNLSTRPTEKTKRLTLAVVGKPNSGKSSFCNRLLGEDRMLVSEVPGTTVDAIDLDIDYRGKQYRLIDTAGMRRQARRADGVEILSAFKSMDALMRADIVLLFVDGLLGPSDQDSKVVEKIMECHKGVILVANKLDLGEEQIPAFRSQFRKQAAEVFHFFEDIPISFISAKTSAGFEKLFDLIDSVWEKLNFRISTSSLNDFFQDVIRLAPAPVHGTQSVVFYYLTQTQQRPPSFIAFANHPDGVTNAYRRFLIKRIKDNWKLEGIPVRIFAMKRGGRELSR